MTLPSIRVLVVIKPSPIEDLAAYRRKKFEEGILQVRENTHIFSIDLDVFDRFTRQKFISNSLNRGDIMIFDMTDVTTFPAEELVDHARETEKLDPGTGIFVIQRNSSPSAYRLSRVLPTGLHQIGSFHDDLFQAWNGQRTTSLVGLDVQDALKLFQEGSVMQVKDWQYVLAHTIKIVTSDPVV